MKKLLIITYYWPPSGGGGVQRWLKFTKYLPEFGWSPIVYTPDSPQFENVDERLVKGISSQVRVIRQPISEPYHLFNKLFFFRKRSFKQGVVSEKSTGSVFDSIVSWIRGNLFLPDPKVSWVNPSVNYLSEVIKKENIAHVVTTGPPHSMHLIGLKLKARHDIIWTADFRDPWSDWDILDLFHLTKRSKRIHERLEEKVIRNADAVISVSESWATDLRQRYNRKIDVITNGFDQADFEDFLSLPMKEFRMLHAGLLNSYRNSEGFWQVLEELLSEKSKFSDLFRLVLAGNVTREVTHQIDEFPLLSSRTIVLGYIDHDQLMKEYAKASALLLLQNDTKNSKGHIPAKVFEYLSTKIPVCAIGNPDSDLGDIIKDYNSIGISAPHNSELQKENVVTIFNSFLEKKPLLQPNDPKVFQRTHLAKSLASLLNKLDEAKN